RAPATGPRQTGSGPSCGCRRTPPIPGRGADDRVPAASAPPPAGTHNAAGNHPRTDAARPGLPPPASSGERPSGCSAYPSFLPDRPAFDPTRGEVPQSGPGARRSGPDAPEHVVPDLEHDPEISQTLLRNLTSSGNGSNPSRVDTL